MATPNTFSKPLTKAQADYAMNRLGTILKQRLTTVIEGIQEPVAVISMTHEQKYAAIVSGKANLMPVDDVQHTYLTSAYTYPQYDAALKLYNVQNAKYKLECTKLQKPVLAAYRVAMDTLMLGNAEAALEVLERFAAGK